MSIVSRAAFCWKTSISNGPRIMKRPTVSFFSLATATVKESLHQKLFSHLSHVVGAYDSFLINADSGISERLLLPQWPLPPPMVIPWSLPQPHLHRGSTGSMISPGCWVDSRVPAAQHSWDASLSHASSFACRLNFPCSTVPNRAQWAWSGSIFWRSLLRRRPPLFIAS